MPVCSDCGKDLDEHDLDAGFELPDVVWAIPPEEREERAIYTPDLCALDGKRFFIRGVAYVRVHGGRADFGWGLWAEVPEDVFEWYRSVYDSELRAGSHARGLIANTPPGYESLAEQSTTLVFRVGRERPKLELLPSSHGLYVEQRDGISEQRLHEIIGTLQPEDPKLH